jgi:hypothetical protein
MTDCKKCIYLEKGECIRGRITECISEHNPCGDFDGDFEGWAMSAQEELDRLKAALHAMAQGWLARPPAGDDDYDPEPWRCGRALLRLLREEGKR